MTMIYTNLYMKLNFSTCNGSMSVDLVVDDQSITSWRDVDSGIIEYTTDLILPCKLKFILSNKTSADTIIKDNQIIADKYVQLQALTLGNIPINSSKLFEICNYEYNQQIANNTFWAFNGCVTIDFNSKNFISWHLAHDNLFDL